jgi:rhodanese-related sulfurtransferase
MPTNVDRDQVQQLRNRGAQVVEVLPTSQYKQGHLPGAINIPLPKLDRKTAARLQKDKPVVVYCYDYQ